MAAGRLGNSVHGAKGKLIEQLAGLIADKKLPILEDVRDESDTQIRIVLVPKTRNVDPDLLKESLYKLSELESRFSLNLNVLDAQRTPACWGSSPCCCNGSWRRSTFCNAAPATVWTRSPTGLNWSKAISSPISTLTG
jgi:hypothetical protein